MSLSLRLVILPFLGGQSKTVACSLQSVRDLQWSSPRLLPFENDNVLNDPLLVCVGTSRAIVGVSKLLKVGSAQRRSSHLSNFKCQWRWRNCHVWLQNRGSRATTSGTSGSGFDSGFEVLSSPNGPNSFSLIGLTGGPDFHSLVLGPFERTPRRLKPADGLSSDSHCRKTKTPFLACSGMRP